MSVADRATERHERVFEVLDQEGGKSGLSYTLELKSEIIIIEEECELFNVRFYWRHRSFQEIIDMITYVHASSRCKCGREWPFFKCYPSGE